MTVKNLNLAIPMDLYVSLKRDAELVASPVTTHIRGVLMRYIRSTDEAIQARKVETASASRPMGAAQQALADYAELCQDLPTTDDALNEFIHKRSILIKRASNGGVGFDIPKPLIDLGLVGAGNNSDWQWKFTNKPAPTVKPWNEPDREGESPAEGAARRDKAWADEEARVASH